MVMPKKRSTGSKPKIKRISHQYINRKKSKGKKQIKPEEKPQVVQQAPQQQTYNAQPAQPQVQQQMLTQPVQVNPVQQQPIQQIPQQPNFWQLLLIILVAGAIIFGIVSLMSGGNSGGSSVKCPTSCSSGAIVIYPTCNCPSDSYLSPSTPYIRGGQYDGYKQCICR